MNALHKPSPTHIRHRGIMISDFDNSNFNILEEYPVKNITPIKYMKNPSSIVFRKFINLFTNPFRNAVDTQSVIVKITKCLIEDFVRVKLLEYQI